jgi:hypothetical protein
VPLLSGPHPIVLILAICPLAYIGSSYGTDRLIVTSTDKEGKYEIPAWSALLPWSFNVVGSEDPGMCIYKPGYKTLYTSPLRKFWLMDGKEISVDLNNLPFKKSLTAKELKEDYDNYREHSTCDWGPSHKDWPETEKFMEKAFENIPTENRIELEKYMGFIK